MKVTFFVLLLLITGVSSCGLQDASVVKSIAPPKPVGDGRTSGDLRGIKAMNTHVQGKLLDPDDENTPQFRIEALAGPQLESMKMVAGYYAEAGGMNDYAGGDLNPLGLAVWQRYLEEFSALLAKRCVTSDPAAREVSLPEVYATYKLHERVSVALDHLCQYRIGEAGDVQQVLFLYRLLNGPDLAQESQAWLKFLDQLASGGTGEAFAMAAIYSALMTPEFMLEM